MAVKGSGLGAGPDDGEFKNQTSYDARKGAAKKPQTTFAVKEGMKDQNAPSGVTSAIGPVHPGAGPDASAADVMDPETPAQRGKVLRKQPDALTAKYGMKNGDGKPLDASLAGKVLGEAILSGASALPGSVKADNSSPGRNPG